MVLKFPHIVLTIAFAGLVSLAFSQTNDEESLRKSAAELFESELYDQAFPLYSQLLSLRLESSDYNFHFGACQLYVGENKEKALQYLKYATEQGDVPPLAYFYYGLGLHLNYRFDKAIDFYQKYQGVASKKDRELKLVDTYISQCTNGKSLVSNFTDISVVQRKVLPIKDFYRNYDLTEFGGKIIVKPEEFMSEEDLKRDATFLMYFQKDADLIYYGSYSDKNQTGKDLYFISKLPTGGWSKAQKLSDVINTEFDEDFPFIHPEGNTLYFASKGHNSMGGYDIFKSTRRGDGSWTAPINMEFAINTPWDDFMFISDKEEKSAWFSSNRETNSKEVTVYKIGIQRVALDLTLIKGSFENEGSRKVTITIEDLAQNKKIGVFESNGLDGSYLLDLRGSGKYKFIVEAKESTKVHTGVVEVPRQKGLKQFSQEMKLVIVDGEEQLQIINHFDTPIENESLLTAEILKKQASLNVNANEGDLLANNNSNNSESTPTGNGNKTKPQRIEEAKNQLAELKGDAELMKQKASFLYKEAETNQNSSDQEKVAEAAIAIELASIYNNEAEKRSAAASKMESTINVVENNNLEDAAFNAQLNQATVTAGNFEKLESFEYELPSVIENRLKPQIEGYAAKADELAEAQSNLKAIEDEISYLKEEMDGTKDKDLKAEYQYQIEEAQKAKPVKTAAVAKAEEELKSIETAKDNAEKYVSISKELLGITDEKAETVSPNVTSGDISRTKQQLSEKAKGNEALYAIVAPNSAQAEKAEVADNTSTPTEKPETVANGASNTKTEVAEEAEPALTNTKTEVESKNSAAEETPQAENQQTEIAQNTGAEGNENTSDLNEEIRQIEASESQPDIVTGDYNSYFKDQIAQASQGEDKMLSESRKAEIYDQWIENLNFRIDSLNDRIESESDTDRKLKLSNQVAALEQEVQAKEGLSMASYQAIAELSDAAAEQNPSNGNQNTGSSESTSIKTASKDATPLDALNVKYSAQLKEAQKISEPLDRKTEEAAVNKAWASELSDRISEIEASIESTADEAEKQKLQTELTLAEGTRTEKEDQFETLQKQAQAIAAGENDMISQNQLEDKLQEYVENYDRQAFLNLQGDININPDENQRLVQTNTMTRNWMISLRNEIIKTEARKRNTSDPVQRKAIDEKLIALERDKREVQFRLDSLQASDDKTSPRASANVMVEGSERYKGYENVIDNQTVAELSQNVEDKTKTFDDLSLQLETLNAKLNASPKKSEVEELEDQLAQATQNHAFAKISLEYSQKEQEVVNSIESELLQMQAGTNTPAEREQAIAAALTADANQQMTTAQTMRNESENIKKKSEREPALAEAETAMAAARLAKHEAQLAELLAEKTLAIEEKAIRKNFIIPRGKEAVLPVVSRTLNPNEQADIKGTSEFQAYDGELIKASAMRIEAQQLELLELQLQEQAQVKLTEQISASSSTERAVQTKQAFDLFAKADSVSEQRAIKKREAAFIENEANKDLLSKPEEVYMNVIAYYNTVGKPIAPNSALGDGGSNANNEEIADNGTNQASESTQENNVNSTENTAATDVAENNSEASNTESNKQNTSTQSGKNASNEERIDNQENGLSNPSTSSENNGPANAEDGNSSNNNNEVAENQAAGGNDMASNNGSTSNPIENANRGNDLQNPANQSTASNNTPVDNASANRGSDSQNAENQSTPNNNQVSEQFDLLPPTASNNGNTTPGRLKVSNDILTNTIFDLAPDATNNITSGNNNAASSNNAPIPIDPVMPAGVVYKVQLGAFSKPIDASRFKGIKPIVGERTPSGYIRYTAGQFPNFASADAAKDELKQIGFPDAFVVAYRNGVRATVEETKKYEGKPAAEVPTPQVPGLANAAGTVGNNRTNSAQRIVRTGPLEIKDVNAQGEIFYTVQIGVFGRKVTSPEVYNITPLNEELMSNGNFRYSSGVYNKFTTADQAKQEIRNLGIKDAFVVAYRNGARVSVADARTQLNDQSPAYTGFASTPVASAPVNNTSVVNTPIAEETQTPEAEGQYRVFIGRYTGEVPIEVATILLSLSDQIAKEKDGIGKSSYYYGTFNSEQEAKNEADRLKNLGLTQAKAERL